MSRGGIAEFGILNISATPHPEGIYPELLKKVAGNAVNIYGDLFATISEPQRIEDGYYAGRIVVWTEINENEPGINKEKLEEIDLADLDVNLPANIGFNGRVFYFIFREEDHLIFVEIKNDHNKRFAISRSQRLFERLFAEGNLDPREPMVEITIIPEEDALERIFSIPRLSRLKIHLVRPNADDIDPQDVLDELMEQGARSQDIILVAASKHEGLTPNDRARTQARVAEHNGYVDGKGYGEDGERIERHTRQYPRIIRRAYDEFSSTFAQGLSIAKRTIIRRPRD